MKNKTTRDQIIAAADRLIYQQGYEHTTFADIARAVEISRGNFYFHFKTKDEILDAVIAARLAMTGRMLARWESTQTTPEARIRAFINILIANKTKIKRHGCPVGTLCAELAKLAHPSQPEANKLLTLFHAWLKKQFAAMGRAANADQLAMHLLARSQGAATLASAFHDEKFLRQEARQMNQWLTHLPPPPTPPSSSPTTPTTSSSPTTTRTAKPARHPQSPCSS